ncbi:MAG: DUF5788 family protein [Euryarchaeota archaeon]|nr:DUF5788 family protein [Euryarchaeota archaeon]
MDYDIDNLISEKDRKHLLFGLQRYLVWVGEPIPDEITIDGKTIQLHDLIWKLINKDSLNEPERQWVHNLIHLLENKEEIDKERLENTELTHKQAKLLFDEAAGLLRAIMDLKDLEDGKIKHHDFDRVSTEDRVKDARQWVKYMEKIKE